MGFKEDVSKFCGATGVAMGDVVRKVTFDILSGAITKTPVDTGRCRGNWRVAVGVTDTTWDQDLFDKAGQATLDKGAAILNAAPDNMLYEINISNNVPYAEYLENGSSKQAPQGMLGITIVEVLEHFSATVKAVTGA